MKIAALVHMYPPYHNAGAEHMLHAMLSEAVNRGHRCVVVVDSGPCLPKYGFEPYVHDGVQVTEDKRALRGSDVLLTHLDRTEDAETIALARNIPLVQIFHNNARPEMMKHCDLAVYNTDWLRKAAPCDAPSIVIHPPIWADTYRVDARGEHITLINLQKPKGVEMFYCLAQTMPELKFLGVKGSYGEQVAPPRTLPNLTIIENQKDIRKVYAETKILLMPSSYESYGRCAVEAAISGIPTIAHPTKGLREALGDYGTFPVPDSDSWKCAVNYVLETYAARSREAKWLARNLDPAGDMTRFLAALDGLVESRR